MTTDPTSTEPRATSADPVTELPGTTSAEPVTIRPARPDDLTAIGDLIVESYLADGHLDPDSDYIAVLRDTAARLRDALLLVAVDQSGTLLGSVTIADATSPFGQLARPGELEFRMLAVAPAARGQGVGRLLTESVLAEARSRHIHRIVMSSQDSMRVAHRLYARLGFRRTPDRDWSPVPGLLLQTFALDLPA